MKRLVIALLVLFALASCVGNVPYEPNDPPQPAPNEPQVSVEYADGAWNYIIEVDIPTPCHGIDVDSAVAESYPEQISLTLTTTEPSDDAVCPQVVERTMVEGSVTASEYASMTITLDGERIYEHAARTPAEQEPSDTLCPAVYDPVCAQPPFLPCPPGPDCLTVDPDPRTYPNACEMERDGATLLYEGTCNAQTPGEAYACPTVYDPVCGQPPMPDCPEGFACPTVMPQPVTYGNLCEMEREGATPLNEGACDGLAVI